MAAELNNAVMLIAKTILIINPSLGFTSHDVPQTNLESDNC
jgi:hypothetical protein